MEHALKKERRHAVYVVPPPVPPKDDASDAASRRESLAMTLVEEEFEQVVDTVSGIAPSTCIALTAGVRAVPCSFLYHRRTRISRSRSSA